MVSITRYAMKKKLFLTLFFLLFIAIGVWASNKNNNADFFKSSIFGEAFEVPISQKSWEKAIATNDTSFFQKVLSQEVQKKIIPFVTKYPQKIDIEVVPLLDNEIFFSFLGIQKNSTRLMNNNYAYVGKDFAYISPKGSFTKNSEHNTLFTNTSLFPLPIDGDYVLVNNNTDTAVSLSRFSEEDVELKYIRPGEKFILSFDGNLSNTAYLESIKYGFILSFGYK